MGRPALDLDAFPMKFKLVRDTGHLVGFISPEKEGLVQRAT